MVLVGILSLGVALLASKMPGPVSQVAGTVFGACGGPMVGLYLLGGMAKWTNWIVSICVIHCGKR